MTRKAAKALQADVLAAIPSNWLDPLLTGRGSIGSPPYSVKQLEQLLQGVTARVMAALAKHERIRKYTRAPARKGE